MAYGFYAYIDEAGDEGFVFRDPPEKASSQWFVISAVIVREADRTAEMQRLEGFIPTIFKAEWPNLHFKTLSHDQRAALTAYLSGRPLTAISISWNKREIAEDDRDHTLDQTSRLHHYAIRYLIERISWYCWNITTVHEPRLCRLVFSKCKNLKYENIESYLNILRAQKTSIRWGAVDTENLMIRQSSELLGLKMVDAVASGIYRGLELNPYQRTNATYAKHLRRITYNHGGNYLTYGMKIMPQPPAVEPEHDNRYAWIDEFR